MHPLCAHVLLPEPFRLISIDHQLLVRVQYRATAVEPRSKDLTRRDTDGWLQCRAKHDAVYVSDAANNGFRSRLWRCCRKQIVRFSLGRVGLLRRDRRLAVFTTTWKPTATQRKCSSMAGWNAAWRSNPLRVTKITEIRKCGNIN